jgi:DNA-binding XRE family transcriptional regulator
MKQLIRKIKKVRILQGLSKSDLAKKAKLHKSIIINLENNNCNLNNLIKITRALNINLQLDAVKPKNVEEKMATKNYTNFKNRLLNNKKNFTVNLNRVDIDELIENSKSFYNWLEFVYKNATKLNINITPNKQKKFSKELLLSEDRVIYFTFTVDSVIMSLNQITLNDYKEVYLYEKDCFISSDEDEFLCLWPEEKFFSLFNSKIVNNLNLFKEFKNEEKEVDYNIINENELIPNVTFERNYNIKILTKKIFNLSVKFDIAESRLEDSDIFTFLFKFEVEKFEKEKIKINKTEIFSIKDNYLSKEINDLEKTKLAIYLVDKIKPLIEKSFC